jgi:hypothetical protein
VISSWNNCTSGRLRRCENGAAPTSETFGGVRTRGGGTLTMERTGALDLDLDLALSADGGDLDLGWGEDGANLDLDWDWGEDGGDVDLDWSEDGGSVGS